MSDQGCMIGGCQAIVYAPDVTQSVGKEHFISVLNWRRRRGPQMFVKYAGMSMDHRDVIAAEWQKTVRIEEIPTATPSKR